MGSRVTRQDGESSRRAPEEWRMKPALEQVGRLPRLLLLTLAVGCSAGSPGAPPPAGGDPLTRLGLLLSANHLIAPEGGSATLSIRLSQPPTQVRSVVARLTTGDSSLSVDGPTEFSFGIDDWNREQTLTLLASEDDDADDGFGSLDVELIGAASQTVMITVADNEVPAVAGVRITVKDASRVGAASFPVTAVLPLAYGAFQDASSFRIADSSGRHVPAQFVVLNRWWARDNSIRHVVAHFEATVAPNGQTYAFFRTTGGDTAAPARGVTVTDSSTQMVVDTGALRFVLKKTGFNLFDEVSVDLNDNGSYESSERIIAPGSSEGPVFTGRLAGDVQRARDRTNLDFVIEEAGPMRAVVRVSSRGSFHGVTDHRHGFAMRLHAYAGKPWVKVDYQLQNSAKNVRYSWPLYFEDVSLLLKPALSGAAVRLSLAPGERVEEALAGDGRYLFQSSLTEGSVRRSSGDSLIRSATVAPAKGAPAWADVSDGSRGMAVIIRNFAEMWPNGIEVAPDSSVAVRLWPKWSAQWHEKQLSPTGLYWLEDMQHVYKEVLFYFHGPGIAASALDDLASNFTWHPVPTLQVAEYRRTAVTLDLDGILPNDAKLPWIDQKQDYWLGYPQKYPWSRTFDSDPALDTYAYGWANCEGDTGRKSAGTGGGWPTTNGEFFGSEGVDRWYAGERMALGDLNVRPIWMEGYVHDADQAFLELTDDPYNGWSWRAYEGDQSASFLAAPYLAGTGFGGWTAKGNTHAWFYHVEEHYLASANPWIKDFYKFLGEFRKRELFQLEWNGVNTNTRAEAHMQAGAMQAFRVTGDPQLWDAVQFQVASLAQGRINKRVGGMNETDASGEMGFFARSMINVLVESRGADHQTFAEAWNVLWGIADWNLNISNYSYFINAFAGPGSSSATGHLMADPMAWWYLQTGRGAWRDQLAAYATTGINGGESSPFSTLDRWSGDWTGRVTEGVLRAPKPSETPPARINDLSLAMAGGSVRLSWTAPARARRYHVVWDTIQLSVDFSQATDRRNLWAARPVGTGLVAAPGTRQTLDFAPTGVASGQTVWVAILSFDAENNMSDASNLATFTLP